MRSTRREGDNHNYGWGGRYDHKGNCRANR